MVLLHLDDGGDKLHQEAGHFQQRGVEVVQEVHDEALDVAAVMVLVRHDHQVPVPQLLHIRVVLQARPSRQKFCYLRL